MSTFHHSTFSVSLIQLTITCHKRDSSCFQFTMLNKFEDAAIGIRNTLNFDCGRGSSVVGKERRSGGLCDVRNGQISHRTFGSRSSLKMAKSSGVSM